MIKKTLTYLLLIFFCLCQTPQPGDGTTEETAGYSCKTILHNFPNSPTGKYYIHMDQGEVYRVGCDMETDGGGWTLVWSNIGGYVEEGSWALPNYYLFSETSEDEITTSTFGAYFHKLYYEAALRKHTEWIKLMRLYNSSNEEPIHKQSIRVSMGENQFIYILDFHETECPPFLDGPIKLYVNGEYRGMASHIFTDQIYSFGLATTLSGEFSCPQENITLLDDTTGLYRIDGQDPRRAYEHLFSYNHGSSDFDDYILIPNSMCMYSCWPPDGTNEGFAESFIWGFREDCDIQNCSCIGKAIGPACELPLCFGIIGNDSQVCSSHGDCVAPDECKCHDGYTGTKCDFPVCFGYSANDSKVCSGRGHCEEPNMCTCTYPGYEGSRCEFPICFGKSLYGQEPVCNGSGVCIAPDHCDCYPGFTGNDCSQTTCVTGGCGKHQVCNLNTTMCECDEGWLGPSCEHCNPEFFCSSRGYCMESIEGSPVCKCLPGFTGINCNTTSQISIPKNVNPFINTGTAIILIGTGIAGAATGTSVITLSFCAPALVPFIEIGMSALFSYFQSLSVIVLRNERLKELSSDGVFKIFHLFNFDIAEALKAPPSLENITVVANETYVNIDKLTQKKLIYEWYEVNGMVVIKILATVIIAMICFFIPFFICYPLKDKYPKLIKIGFEFNSGVFTVLYSICLIPLTSSLLQQITSPSVESFTLPGAIIVSVISVITLLLLTVWLVIQFWKQIQMNDEYQRTKSPQNIELNDINEEQSSSNEKKKFLTRSWKQILRYIFFPISTIISKLLDMISKTRLITSMSSNSIISNLEKRLLIRMPDDENNGSKSVFDSTLKKYNQESKLREIDVLLLRKTLWLILAFSLSSFPIAQIVVVLVFQLYYVCFYIVHAPHKTWAQYLSNIFKEVIMLIQLCIMLDIVINIYHAVVGLIVSVALNILVVAVTVILFLERLIRTIFKRLKRKKAKSNK